ncbi:MAG: hypothetical protein ACRCYE_05790 [Sarcina sp.]
MINCIHLTVKMNKDAYEMKDLFYAPENIETNKVDKDISSEYEPTKLITTSISYFDKYR